MSENLPDRIDDGRRRRRPAQALDHLDGGGAIVTREEAQQTRSRIASGRTFRRPEEEFPGWEVILETVRSTFVERSQSDQRLADRLRQPQNYTQLVTDVVSQHPEWRVGPAQMPRLVELLRAYQLGYGPLEDYMRMEDLEELYFNGPDEGFYIRAGVKHRITDRIFRDSEDMVRFLQRVAAENGLEINLEKPVLEAPLRDGSRLNATLPPIAVGSPDFVIRRHREIPFTMEGLIQAGTLTAELAADITQWVRHGFNLVVSGGTSSGKTSLLNTIGNHCLPPDDRVLVLETHKELQIQTEDTKYFQTREATFRESGGPRDITMRDLIRSCLRKRPDRIIVGEVRGEDAYYALTAWNSGHDGSMCTVHADSAPAALAKLEQLAAQAGELGTEAVRALIADAVDVVIQVERVRGRAQRRVREVIQVLHPFKHDHLDQQAVARRKQLEKAGQIIELRPGLEFMTLYRLQSGRLVKVSEPLAVAKL